VETLPQEGSPNFRFQDVDSLTDGAVTLRLSKTVDRDEQTQSVATYHFDVCIGAQRVGGIRFRAENAFDVETYAGNLGYNIDPPFRGHHLAEKACRLLLPLAVAHHFDCLWITCDPDNVASRKTCERLGAELVDIAALPEDSDMYRDGERFKCRYRLVLNAFGEPLRKSNSLGGRARPVTR
jgi:predicted acetyltransferase